MYATSNPTYCCNLQCNVDNLGVCCVIIDHHDMSINSAATNNIHQNVTQIQT